MKRPRAHNTNGFTLVEMLAAAIVMAVIAVTVFPVVFTLIDRTAEANTDRLGIDRATYAMDRVVRLFRETPLTVADELDYTVANATSFKVASFGGVALVGTDLNLVDDTDTTHLLAQDVSSLELKYFAMDGLTETTDKALIWQVRIKLIVDGVELRSHAFIRARIGQE